MANDEYISFWGEKGLQEAKEGEKILENYIKLVVDLNGQLKNIGFQGTMVKDLKEQAKVTETLNSKLGHYVKVVDEAGKANKNLAAFSKEQQAQRKLEIALAKQEAKEIKEVEKAVEKARKEKEKAAKQSQAEEARAKKEQIALDRQAKKDLDDYIASVKKGSKELEDLTKAYQKKAEAAAKGAAGAAAKASAKQEAEAAKELARLTKELDKDRKALEAQTKREAKEVEKLGNAYVRLSRAHQTAAAEARHAAIEHGLDSKQFQAAEQHANALFNRLYEVDKRLGDHRRNVGNYSSAWNGLGMSIQQIAREVPNFAQDFRIGIMAISNNLPILADEIARVKKENAQLIAQGKPTVSLWKQIAASIFSWQTALTVGITVMVAYSKEIGDFFSKIKQGIKGVDMAAERMRLLNSVVSSSAESFSKAATEVQLLKERFFDAKASIQDKQRVVTELNTAYGDTIGKIGSINEAERFFIDRSSAFIQALQLRAQIEGAYDLIAENAKKLIEEQTKSADEQTNFIQKTTASFVAINKWMAGDIGKTWADVEKEQDRITQDMATRNMNNLKNKTERSNKIITDFVLDATKKLNEVNSANNFNFDPTGKSKSGNFDPTNEQVSASQRIAAAMAELNKVQLEEEKNKNQLIFQNEQAALSQRLEAYSRFLAAELALNDLNQNQELESKNIALAKIAEIEGKAVKDRTREEQTLLLQKEAIEAEKTAIVAKYQIKENDIIAAAQKFNTETYQKESKRQADIIMGQLDTLTTNLQAQKESERIALAEQLSNGQITYRQYTRQKALIDDKYQAESLAQEKDFLAKKLAEAGLLPPEIARIQALITQIEKEESQNRIKTAEDEAKAKIEKQKQTLREIVQAIAAAMQVANTIGDMIGDRFQQRIEALEREGEIIEENGRREIDRINNSALTEEQKEEAIRKAQAKTDFERRKNEARQRQEKMRQARFDKAANIADVIGKTAVAIIEAFTEGDPYTKAIRAAIAGSVGAAQIIRAVSAPLPQYAKGTDDSGKAGLAIVGEKGPEMVVENSGKAWITPGTASLVHLPAHSKVITNDELMRGAFSVPAVRQQKVDPYTKMMLRELQALNNKPTKSPTTIIHIDSTDAYIKRKLHR